MRKVPITITVSRTVPERISRKIIDCLGQMQEQAIERGLGTSWKCGYKDGKKTYYVGQEGTRFLIHREGDTPNDLMGGTEITAEALADLTLKEYTSQVKAVLQEKAVGRCEADKLDEVLRHFKTSIFVGFTNSLSCDEVAKTIIEAMRE